MATTKPKTRKPAGKRVAAKPKAPNPVGRPTDYRPEYCDKIIALGKEGKSVVQMACAFDVVKNTLTNWAEAHPEFLSAFTRAKQFSQDWWERTGQTAMMLPGFNAQVWSRSMAARFPDDYTERSKHELTGKDGGAIETRAAEMTPEQRREEIQRLLAENPALIQHVNP